MTKIIGITNPSFKSGVSEKTGKPWTLMTVQVDDGRDATIFAPAAIGDEVKMKPYKDSWNAEKVTQASKERDEIISKLDEILTILKAGGQEQQPAKDLPSIDQLESPF